MGTFQNRIYRISCPDKPFLFFPIILYFKFSILGLIQYIKKYKKEEKRERGNKREYMRKGLFIVCKYPPQEKFKIC